MDDTDGPSAAYYRRDLSLVHHRGFGFHADACAPGILRLLAPVLARNGLVVELGCGSGLLTRYLIEAGHRVVATDASPAMLDVARDYLPAGTDLRPLVLPDDPIPPADAVVSIGHVISYLPDEAAVDRALAAAAQAVRPGGVLALDICDLEWGRARLATADHSGALPNSGRVGDDWAIVMQFSVPTPTRFVRRHAAFTRNSDGSWQRDDEVHENVLVDTSLIPARLAEHGVEATVAESFGDEQLPAGLRTVIGHRPR